MKKCTCFAAGSLALLAGVSCADISYFNDFQSGSAGSEWSTSTVETAPLGGQRFLGQFSNQAVSLTLPGVQAGELVSLAFDFCAIRTWDGNASSLGPGPDVFSVQVSGGPLLLSSTFRVGNPELAGSMRFPQASGFANNPSRTGSVANDTLGYLWLGAVLDATWRMSFTFTAPGNGLTVNFGALGLQPADDESWALDNVSVQSTTVPGPSALALLGVGWIVVRRRQR